MTRSFALILPEAGDQVAIVVQKPGDVIKNIDNSFTSNLSFGCYLLNRWIGNFDSAS